MASDDLLVRCAANCGRAYGAWARAAGLPVRMSDRLLLADLRMPVASPPNNATLLAPLAAPDIEDVVEALRGFFGGPGGGYQLWSIWPTPDLTPHGFGASFTPAMVRDAGGPRPPVPGDLEIERVLSPTSLAAAAGIVGTVFGVPEVGPALMPSAMLDDPDLGVWVGRVDGDAVSAAMAFVSDGFVGIYAVATLPEARGRGYGEAITWAGLDWRADLPATLQASTMGQPIYERMGFRTVAEFTVWTRPSR